MWPSSRAFRALVAFAGAAGLLDASSLAGEKPEPERPADIEVNGLDWLKNREQRISLERLLGTERGGSLDAAAIEDAEFLLMSALIEQGYLKPVIRARLTAPNGAKSSSVFDATLENTLPRSVQAKRVEFDVKPGVRYRFDRIEFSGLHAISEEVAREFFIGERVLITRGSANLYSPTRLNRALDGVEGELRRLGYADCTVRAAKVQIDDATGHVDVDVEIVERARWEVTSVRAEISGEIDDLPMPLDDFVGRPWTPFWEQDVAEIVRNRLYRRGHPDVKVQPLRQVGPEANGVRPVSVVVRIDPGPRVTIGQVRFEGAQKTAAPVLERRVRTTPGEPLNPLAIEQARFRLGRLGIFDRIDVRYEPNDGLVRDPVFTVVEGREMEANLLFGYGSYEQLRGGVELRQLNLFGRAHQSRLLLVQSLKSSRGEYSYTMPELFGESVDGTARAFGLQRQETSFIRQEYGVNFSAAAPVHRLGVNATAGYTYQALRNQDNALTTRSNDDQQVTAGSVDTTIVRERRDNPLRPRRGYRWFAQAETASRFLGGSVDYQRLEFGASYHTPWTRGRWVHLGVNHGAITTFGSQSDDSELPVNKRFFPGGDNSIRGYQAGEAAPRGSDGRYIGAKSFLLVNAELEQALTPKWSVVVFADALGTAVRLADYPFSETLYSVGLGVRYQTLIGPLRAEYGRNLNPRAGDPGGTLLLSVGFPF